MKVAALWRYPVKSLQGERVTTSHVDRRGLDGDRRWAIVDVASGYTLTARRVPELLYASAAIDPDGDVRITLEHGAVVRSDAELSDWLGRRVELVTAGQRGGLYETPVDPEDEGGAWRQWRGPGGAFHDSARTQVSIVSTTSVGEWDPRRFRANVVVDAGGEDDLVGSTLSVGSAQLEIVKRIDRCVVVTRAQPGIARDLDVWRRLRQDRDACIGVAATVSTPGTIAVGDEIRAR
jgi:hypothetical protein